MTTFKKLLGFIRKRNMDKLICALENANGIIQIGIQQNGFDLTIYSKIVDTEKFMDGITLSLENENKIFISSLLNKVVDIDVKDDVTEYTIVTPSKAIISILVEK